MSPLAERVFMGQPADTVDNTPTPTNRIRAKIETDRDGQTHLVLPAIINVTRLKTSKNGQVYLHIVADSMDLNIQNEPKADVKEAEERVLTTRPLSFHLVFDGV